MGRGGMVVFQDVVCCHANVNVVDVIVSFCREL